MKAGVPQEKTAFGVNQLCGSGLRAVALGLQQIANGDANIIVAGGQESMSLAPHAAYLRSGVKMGEMKLVDTMLQDGLIDAFHGYHMGNTAENIAKKWQITREEQDRFAVGSQNKAEAAQKAGRFKDEIVARDSIDAQGRHRRRRRRISARRLHLRGDGETQARLFQGRIGNRRQRLRPQRRRGRIGHHDRRGGQAPRADADGAHRLLGDRGRRSGDHGHGADSGDPKALEKAGWSVKDLELVEANEAFAAQALAVNKDLGWDPAIVNVNGGAIALGHPIGASGARVLTTLLHEMARRNAKKGLATLCIGGGMGIAMAVER